MTNLALGLLLIPFLGFFVYIVAVTIISIIFGDRVTSEKIPNINADADDISYNILIFTTKVDKTLTTKIAALANSENAAQIAKIVVGIDAAANDKKSDLSHIVNEHGVMVPVEYYYSPARQGKNAMINTCLLHADAEILIFTDIDAILERDFLRRLNTWFADDSVGTVVGQRLIQDTTSTAAGQKKYLNFDLHIKNCEMKIFGFVSSCDGKFYAIRRNLVDSIPLYVTDDLYIGLGAYRRGKRLVHDQNIKAFIGRPAKNIPHEIERRKRVTTRGLHTLAQRIELLNAFKYGPIGICLLLNKFCRRLAPLSAFFGILYLTFHLTHKLLQSEPSLILFGCLLLAVSMSLCIKRVKSWKKTATFLFIGLYAMTLGTIDFLRGKKIAVWEPVKTDPS